MATTTENVYRMIENVAPADGGVRLDADTARFVANLLVDAAEHADCDADRMDGDEADEAKEYAAAASMLAQAIVRAAK